MNADPKAVQALALARDCFKHMGPDEPEWLSGLYQGYAAKLARAFQVLDDAGVFAALDEATDYASAEEILAESAAMHLDGRLTTLDPAFYGKGAVRATQPDPAEWGDTTAADMARHQLTGTGHDSTVCDADPLASPSQHSGQCPTWARHHHLVQADARRELVADALAKDEAEPPVRDEMDASDRAAMGRLARKALGLDTRTGRGQVDAINSLRPKGRQED